MAGEKEKQVVRTKKTDKSKKAKKGTDGASGSKRPRTTFNSTKFLSAENHEIYDTVLKEKSVIPERGFITLILHLYPELEAVMERRKWQTLMTFPTNSSSKILKEFCANADMNTVAQTRKSWVRGVEVPFDGATIERFLQTSYDPTEDCAFVTLYNRMQPHKGAFREDIFANADMIRERIATPHADWKDRTGPKRRNIPEKFARLSLTREALVWHTFVNDTIIPSMNKSDVNVERAALLFTILGEGNLDISSILSDRILHILTKGQGRFNLAHSSLISHLCTQAGLVIPENEVLDVKVPDPFDQHYIQALYNESDKQSAWLATHKEEEGADDDDQQAQEDQAHFDAAPSHLGPLRLHPEDPYVRDLQREVRELRIQGDRLGAQVDRMETEIDFQSRVMTAMGLHMGIDITSLRHPPVPPPSPPAVPAPAPTDEHMEE